MLKKDLYLEKKDFNHCIGLMFDSESKVLCRVFCQWRALDCYYASLRLCPNMKAKKLTLEPRNPTPGEKCKSQAVFFKIIH